MTKVKIPKRIGGVKVPKKVRKQAKKALKLAAEPAGARFRDRRLIAAAEPGRGASRGGTARRRRSRERKATLDALELGEVFRAAAIEGARRFLEGFEEGLRDARSEATRSRDRGGEAAASRKPAQAEAAKPPRSRRKPPQARRKPGKPARRLAAPAERPPRSWPRIAPAGCGAVWTFT